LLGRRGGREMVHKKLGSTRFHKRVEGAGKKCIVKSGLTIRQTELFKAVTIILLCHGHGGRR